MYIKKWGVSALLLTYMYSKRLKHAIIQFRRAAMLKCCHTGFEHAHNCHNAN